MSKQTYLLSFEGVTEAEASLYVAELREALLNASVELEVQRQRKNPLTQDLGTTLVLILGAPAVVAAVQVIGNWLQKRRNASLTIMTAEEKIIVKNISHKDAIDLVRLRLQQHAEERKPDA